MIREEELVPYLDCFINELNGPIRSNLTNDYSTKVVDAIILVLRRLKAQRDQPVDDVAVEWTELAQTTRQLFAWKAHEPSGHADLTVLDSALAASAQMQAILADEGQLARLVEQLQSASPGHVRWAHAVSCASRDMLETQERAIRPSRQQRVGAGTVADGIDRLTINLSAYLQRHFPTLPDDPIIDMTVAAGGQIKRTILFRLKPNDVLPERLVLRQDMPLGFTGTVVTDEYAVIQRMWGLGLPVPQPFLCEADESLLGGRFMIMAEIVDARMAGTYFAEERAYMGSEMGPGFGEDVARLMARLHAGTLATATARDESAGIDLAAFGRDWASLRKPANSIATEMGLAWMLANPLPAGRPRVLVHGDAGAHNMMARDGRLAALLDWELAHIGDPAEDLAQIKTLLLPDVMPWDDFKHAYLAAGGPPAACDDHAIAYYAIWTYLKHLGMNARLWNHFMTGERDDAPAASIAAHFIDRLLLYEARAVADAFETVNGVSVAPMALA